METLKISTRMRTHRRKKYLQFTWFISYIFILLIPIIFSTFIIIFVANGIKKEIGKANAALLDQVQFVMDQHLTDIMRLFIQIQFDPQIQILSMADGEFDAENYYSIYKTAKQLNSLNFSSQFYDDILVYFKSSQTVLSSNGHMPFDLYYYLYVNSKKYTIEEFRMLLEDWNVNRITLLDINESGQAIMFLNSNSFFGLMEAPSTFAVVVNESKIRSMLENMKIDANNIVFVLDGNGDVISSTASEDSYEMIRRIGLIEDSYSESKEINSVKYTVSSAKSQQMDWRYVIMTPDSSVYESLRKVQLISIGSLLACLIVGGVFSSILVKLNYSPIRDLIGLFHKSSLKYNNEQSEIQWMHDTVQEVLKERETTVSELRRSKQMYKNTVLNKILKGRYLIVNPENRQREFDSIELKLNSPYYAVVMMNIEDMEYLAESSENSVENLELEKFIVMNVFNEVFGEEFETETCEADDYVTAIVGLKSDGREYLEMIIEKAYIVQQKVKSHFKIEMTVSIGDIAAEVMNVSSSYVKALEVMEYRSWLGLKEIITYADTENLQQKYNYSIETENKIINFIRVGDREAVRALVFEVLDAHLTGEKISIGLARCLVFDIIGTIIKAIEYIGDINLGNEFKTDDFTILAKSSLPNIKAEFVKLIDIVCSSTEQRAQTESKHDELSKNVTEYILENYTDPNMNISQIGYRFDLTPAYLSRIFKDQTGESLLGYINAIRIKAAEKLIYEGYNVSEAAEAAGFANTGTMIRIFKKVTGVTPGQLKKTI